MQNLVEVYKTATEQLQQVVSQTPERIKKLNEAISRADLEVQDLLHLAELESFNASQGYYIANQIKKARIKRRQAKDEVDVLMSIKSVLNQNSKFEPHVQNIQKSINTKLDIRGKRTYTARVRSDLIERFNKCNINKLLK